MYLTNFLYCTHLIRGKCCILECKKWLSCWCCRRFLVSSRILLKYGNYCAFYLTHNLLESMGNDGRSDITFTLLFVTNAVSVGISGKSLCRNTAIEQDKCKTMAVEIIGFGDLVKGNYKISHTKIFAFKVNSWELKVNNWKCISSCTDEDKQTIAFSVHFGHSSQFARWVVNSKMKQ